MISGLIHTKYDEWAGKLKESDFITGIFTADNS
jgi:hypothetical protein